MDIREEIYQQIELAILGVAVNVGCNPDGDIGGLVIEARKAIVGMLHSKDVVRKVDRELPYECICSSDEVHSSGCISYNRGLKAGYVAVEDLP